MKVVQFPRRLLQILRKWMFAYGGKSALILLDVNENRIVSYNVKLLEKKEVFLHLI